ncbi:hypothetical protein [Aidingimonas halophila]|nr:hypothetical protein [Aidingimonas halophila]GHC17908.1 hypothetical protein GCM10008094_04530 [Aidingimonas halophila]
MIIEAVMMLMAIVPVMISLYLSFITNDGQWFQRSGALMVLFSIGVEYHRKQELHPAKRRDGALTVASSRLAGTVQRCWRAIPFVCYLAVVIGTLIWSYGDLLFV